MRAKAAGVRALGYIVSNLAGWADVTVLRAAAKAGATAVLNLEGVAAPEVRQALAALVRNKPGRVGVRLHSACALDALGDVPAATDVVIVAAGAIDEAIDLLDRVRSPSREILLECTSADQARAGVQAGVDGLVAKGHESGGRAGDETTFVLVQRLLAETHLPVYAHGGIGIHTAGACLVAGCAGVVLDVQLALARESTLPPAVKTVLDRMGGDETVCLGAEIDDLYRVYRRPGFQAVEDLRQAEIDLAQTLPATPEAHRAWRDAIEKRINWTGIGAPLWPLGQDAVLARSLARRFRSVGGIIAGLSDAAVQHLAAARELRPLDRGTPLAVAHRTEFPILQGPMTRVSDTPAFANAVAAAGGLPFVALALLRGPQVRSLLAETKQLLETRPWGVGILGFLPNELREEQMRAIEEFAPPFAVIAGGRPDQAAQLEEHGTAAYLHVPAPSLLEIFLNEGARRFVFEGRECGGHVGPRTSFVLWESMVETLVGAIERGIPAADLHVVFAGGIHDALSSAMVATIGAPLAKLGVRLGVLMGTAYLFTEEAVATGAIVEGFQEEALKCSRTVLLETGPGHASRCARTPFFDLFRETRRRYLRQGESPDDIRLKLESLNLGRLRVAAKGIAHAGDDRRTPGHVAVGPEQQHADGMYMIGQVAALRDSTCRIADLHNTVAVGGSELLNARIAASVVSESGPPAAALSSNIAIVGVGCLLPHATDGRTLWSQIVNKADAIREIPPDRFDSARYFDADRRARDRIYSKWGGFLPEIPFDPLKYGITPASVPSIDPFQLLTLEVVYQALGDAGYDNRPFNRDRTSVILGASGGVGDLGFRYGIRAGLPMFLDPVPETALAQLPEWTEDSFAGVLLNVAAGRVANRLNLGGLNFTIDAACASSLAAVYVAARELESGASDMVIVGGIDTVNSPFGYLCFSSAQALSPTGTCRPFDESADGIVISEGLVALVLKRLGDAERDGDRVYAVIRGVAGSSDGRGKGLTAPRPEGQIRVLERAYAAAGISPATIGLVEAHGTGTVAGDAAEVTSLSHVFGAAGTPAASCALGSIKSMIGHTKSAAGVSGLLKVALSLYHKVLPPTLHVKTPNAKLRAASTPFFVNTEAQPWIAPEDPGQPRRAAASSFGFGGTNFHVVLEEYDRNDPGVFPESAPLDLWPAELACWTADDPQQLAARLEALGDSLSGVGEAPVRNIAAAICRAVPTGAPAHGATRLAIVATSCADLRAKIAAALDELKAGKTAVSDSNGVYLSNLSEPAGKIAFLFSGQGSQYPGMHRDLALYFPELRHSLEIADRATSGLYARRLSSYVFPPPAFSDEQRRQQLADLTDTSVAQPALGAVEKGLCDLLARLGVRPHMTAGHSYGEYVALSAADVFPPDVLFEISAARGRVIKTAAGANPGTMAAVSAPADSVARVLGNQPDVWIANLNSPRQTVLAAGADAMEAAVAVLAREGLAARRIPVACAFHSPLVAAAGRLMAEVLSKTDVRPPRIPVFSNTLAARYPEDPDEIRALLARHITEPVRFAEELEAMYRDGARIFVEVGPRSVLANLARETLSAGAPLILSVDSQERHGVAHLLHVVAQLAVAGVPIDFEELVRGRTIERIDLANLARSEELPPHMWMVNGSRARRLGETKPVGAITPVPPQIVLPQAPEEPEPSIRVEPDTTEPDATEDLVIPQGGPMQPTPTIAASQFVVDVGADDVMRQFQQIMTQFLHTQALVMTTYLQGAPAAGLPALPTVAAPVPRAVAQPPVSAPQPIQARTKPAPPPAPQPAVAAPPVAAAPPPAAPAKQAATTPSDVLSQLLHIVCERTGYPQEMLRADANIEADLGIDSIKRMEILTAFQELHPGANHGVFQGAMEKLTASKTLRQTASVLTELLAGRAEAVVA